jgi:hypothetical protein
MFTNLQVISINGSRACPTFRFLGGRKILDASSNVLVINHFFQEVELLLKCYFQSFAKGRESREYPRCANGGSNDLVYKTHKALSPRA